MMRSRRLLTTAALAATAALLAGCSSASPDVDGEVRLNFAFWGNDDRATLYDEVIDAFETEHPNIAVETTFLDYNGYWEKRQTEAAGGGLPDVFQFGTSFLRQYAQNGLLLDLTPHLGDTIRTDALTEEVLATGQVDDATLAVTVSTNFWSLWSNPTLIDRVGVEPFAGGTWDEYAQWLTAFTAAAEQQGIEAWGGTDFTGRIQSFELQQRAAGEDLFTEDGKANFSRAELARFWNSTADLRGSATIPQQRTEELLPLSPFDSALTATDVSWDSLGPGFLANLGAEYPELDVQAPPTTSEGAKDLYPNAGMQLAASSNTDHPEEAALLIDYLVNEEITGEVFGLNRGMPASATALAGAELAGIETQIAEHEQSLGGRVGDPPPTPVLGYGSIEEKFRQLGVELNFGTITVDEAVEQFFAELEVILAG